MKGMALNAIHGAFVRTLGNDAVAYSTVIKYAHSAQFSGRKEASPPKAPDLERNPVDEAILTALAEFPFPFSSVRELSRRICPPRSTVHRHWHITQSLRFTSRCDMFDGRTLLTAEQKQIRVQTVNELLQVLSVQSTCQWHDIVTLDEPCIYLFSEHDLMWTTPGEIVVDRERHTVQSPKFLLTVVSNPIGLHVLKSLPKGRKFSAQYYTNDILVAISDWRRQTGVTRPNKLWVHSDNARPHTAKMSRDYIGLNRMKQAPHPPIRQIWHPRTFSFLDASKES
jgi:hypothetical protein